MRFLPYLALLSIPIFATTLVHDASACGGCFTVTVTPVPSNRAPAPTAPATSHLDEQLAYQYDAMGRRDPFQPLVGGGFVGNDVGGDAPVDVGGMKVVGIVWGSEDKFAMVEDAFRKTTLAEVLAEPTSSVPLCDVLTPGRVPLN